MPTLIWQQNVTCAGGVVYNVMLPSGNTAVCVHEAALCTTGGGGYFVLNATYTVFSKNPPTVLVLKHLWPKCLGQRRAEPHCHLLAGWCPTRRVPGVALTPCTCLPSSGAPQCRSKEKQMDVCFPLNIRPCVGFLLLLFSTCYYFEKEESELAALFCFFFN